MTEAAWIDEQERRRRQAERERLADEAFFDGMLLGHRLWHDDASGGHDLADPDAIASWPNAVASWPNAVASWDDDADEGWDPHDGDDLDAWD